MKKVFPFRALIEGKDGMFTEVVTVLAWKGRYFLVSEKNGTFEARYTDSVILDLDDKRRPHWYDA